MNLFSSGFLSSFLKLGSYARGWMAVIDFTYRRKRLSRLGGSGEVMGWIVEESDLFWSRSGLLARGGGLASLRMKFARCESVSFFFSTT